MALLQSFLVQWESTMQVDENQLQQNASPSTWTKSAESTLKVNADASWDEMTWKASIGAFLRNSDGYKIGEISRNYQHVQGSLIAEPLTLQATLEWLTTMSTTHVQIELDALLMIQALNSNSMIHSSFGLLINDCKSLSYVSVSFIPIFMNVVAHELARGVFCVRLCGVELSPSTIIITSFVYSRPFYVLIINIFVKKTK